MISKRTQEPSATTGRDAPCASVAALLIVAGAVAPVVAAAAFAVALAMSAL